jgi:chemotaxis protein methyltransferase CheR
MQDNSAYTPKPPPGLGYGDYLRFSQLVQERFGLFFPEKRRMELEIGVRRAFSASTCTDLDGYFELLNTPGKGAPELERLVNALTVGETYFFRDAGQFNALLTRVLPEIIERRRMVRTLRIWSAGCASGEEPYSIAMALVDLLPDLKDWTVTILATDINTQNLERARKGLYTEWAFREERARQLRNRFFTTQGNLYQLDAQIRRMVTFTQLNLASSQYPSYENNTMYMDLILCRNVTIYFPEFVTREVIDRFYNSLSDFGWLVVGHSEHSINTYQKFQALSFPDAILYQRTGVPTPPIDFFPLKPATDQPAFPQQNFFPPTATPVVSSLSVPPVTPPTSGISKTLVNVPPVTPSEPGIAANEFEQAQAQMSFGKVSEACEMLLRWLSKHPNHPQACALLAKAYADQGNMREAERWSLLTIEVDRLNIEAYYILALIYQHQGLPDKALDNMKKVVYIERNDILGHFSLANLYHDRSQIGQALKSLENARKLLEHRPDDEVIPRSDGVTAGRLKHAVLTQQQQWADLIHHNERENPPNQ